MTHRTLMYVAAALAFHMAAGPVWAGPTMSTIVPSLHYVESNEFPTRSLAAAPTPGCSRLEKSMELSPEKCGIYSRAQLQEMKTKRDK